MSRGKIMTAVIAVAFLVLLFVVFRSCRSGTRPPAERDRLEGTSYRAELHSARMVVWSTSELEPLVTLRESDKE